MGNVASIRIDSQLCQKRHRLIVSSAARSEAPSFVWVSISSPSGFTDRCGWFAMKGWLRHEAAAT